MRWADTVRSELAAFESGERYIHDFSVASVAEMAKVSRTTLWRNAELRGRLQALSQRRRADARHRSEEVTLKRTVKKLREDLSTALCERDALALSVLFASERLMEAGIDPSQVFGADTGASIDTELITRLLRGN